MLRSSVVRFERSFAVSGDHHIHWQSTVDWIPNFDVARAGHARCQVRRSASRRLYTRGHFAGKHVGTPFKLLKCLRTHYGRHCEPFSGQNALYRRILYNTVSKLFRGRYPRAPAVQKCFQCLEPDTNFRLAGQRSHCSCFTKRTLLCTSFLSVSF